MSWKWWLDEYLLIVLEAYVLAYTRVFTVAVNRPCIRMAFCSGWQSLQIVESELWQETATPQNIPGLNHPLVN